MDHLHAHYRKLNEQLKGLRSLLSNARYLKYFDESLEANEFGEALHALCDFLMEPGAPPVSRAALDEIESLHTLMGIQDNCAKNLAERRGGRARVDP